MILDELETKVKALIHHIAEYRVSKSDSKYMKIDLEKIFGITIDRFIVTLNTDKSLFGILVFPFVDKERLYDLVNRDVAFIPKKVDIEMDSKLFDMELTNSQIAACMIQVVGGMVSDSKPFAKALNYMKHFVMNTTTGSMILSESPYYDYLLKFGFTDAMQKTSSMFLRNSDDVLKNDTFINDIGIELDVSASYENMKAAGKLDSTNGSESNTFTILEWSLRLYSDILRNRIDAIHILDDSIRFTASMLQCEMMKQLKEYLKRISDDMLIQSECVTLVNEGRQAFANYKHFVTEMNSLTEDVFTDKEYLKESIVKEAFRINAFGVHSHREQDKIQAQEMLANLHTAYTKLE